MSKKQSTKKRPSALAQAASRKLAGIGAPNEHDVAHYLFHAEERGEAVRVPHDGPLGWAWQVTSPQGNAMIAPTPGILAAFEQFKAGIGHNHD
jgi:hypothetical protein